MAEFLLIAILAVYCGWVLIKKGKDIREGGCGCGCGSCMGCGGKKRKEKSKF